MASPSRTTPDRYGRARRATGRSGDDTTAREPLGSPAGHIWGSPAPRGLLSVALAGSFHDARCHATSVLAGGNDATGASSRRISQEHVSSSRRTRLSGRSTVRVQVSRRRVDSLRERGRRLPARLEGKTAMLDEGHPEDPLASSPTASRVPGGNPPMRVFLVLLSVAFGLSVVVPFVVVSVRDGSIVSGARWVVSESGVLGGLVGCALVSPLLRRWQRRERLARSDGTDGSPMHP